MAPTLNFCRVGDVMVLVHGHRDPFADEWLRWTTAYVGACATGLRKLFVVSAGGGPNARQRKQVVGGLVALLGPAVEELATAICGSSASVRTIAAAIGWLVGAPRFKLFASRDRVRALDYLKVPEPLRTEVLQTVSRFETALASSQAPLGAGTA